MEHKFALVFVHGLLGFDKYGILGFDIECFRGIRKLLSKQNCDLYFPCLPAIGAIKQRATKLAYYLDEIDADYICIIAHSMGGLDARYVISHLDPKNRIKHLITLGTPHHGSPVANWVLHESGLINAFLRKLTHPAIHELTLEACKRFNQDVLNRKDVHYDSYAGKREAKEMPSWFRFRQWSERMNNEFGANDCLVPANSARWGHFFSTVRADHFELIGWNLGGRQKQIKRPFDYQSFYLSLAESAYKRFEKFC